MNTMNFDLHRRHLGLTSEELATLCDTTGRTVRRWMTGAHAPSQIALDTLVAIEKAMKYYVQEIVESYPESGVDSFTVSLEGLPSGPEAMARVWAWVELGRPELEYKK